VVTFADGTTPPPLSLVPSFELDDATAVFFDGERRIDSYQMDFVEIDRKLLAIELADFAYAVSAGRSPEVTGDVALNSVVLCCAMLESGYRHTEVSVGDVREDRIHAYQSEINDAIGL
jgi:hypothetical protein